MIDIQAITALTAQGLIVLVLPDGSMEIKAPSDTRSAGARRASAYRARHAHPRLYPSSKDWQSLRELVFQRDNGTCTYCGSTGNGRPLHCDHIVALSRGGTNDLANLTTACESCNSSKKNLSIEEWRSKR